MSKTNGQLGLLMLPPALDTAEFRSTWQDWLDDRATRRLPRYTAKAQTLQIERLAEMGAEAAISAINWSIMQGYKGIFAPNPQIETRPATAKHGPFPEPPWALEKRIGTLRTQLRDLKHPGGCPYAVDLSGSKLEQAKKIESEIQACKAKLEAARNED